ncbi:MAG: endonuclease/exonuclease/phosphatase family protein [Bacteroidota bacterium]
MSKSRYNKLSFISRLLLILNYIVAACLLISYAAHYINPEYFWQLAFFGMAYPILLAINILFVFFWIIKWKKYFLLSLIVVAAGYTHLFNFIQIRNINKTDSIESKLVDPEKSGFKLLSYNVRLFDLYNWRNNRNIVTRNKIFDFIRDESADVICLQEFFSDNTGYFTTLDTIIKFQDAKNYHVEYTQILSGKHHWGIATFSKYPVVNKGKILFESKSNNICIFTDIKVKNDTIRIYNAHLASMHFQYKDYQFLQNLGNIDPGYTPYKKDLPKKKAGVYEGTKTILKRVKAAFIKRAKQAEHISEHISRSPYPVIICGDFNDTPTSYAYHKIAGGLTDAFTQSGSGLGRTYIGAFPSFRIDYILHSKKLNSFNFQTITSNDLSDHYPLSCYIEVNTDD